MSHQLDQEIQALAAQANIRLRAYDLPAYLDRYTVVYDDGADRLDYIGMNASPFHPQGFGQHGEIQRRNVGSHLGKTIAVTSLPEDCKRLVAQDLRCITEPIVEPAS